MKRKQSGQVLIILFGSLLLGGAGVSAALLLTGKTASEIRKGALSMVEDPERRDQIKAVLGRWEKEAKRLDKTRNENIRKVTALVRRHDATSGDFAPVFAAFDEMETQGFEAALAMRFALREQLSAEEWRRLFPSPAAKSASWPGAGRRFSGRASREASSH